MPPTELISSDSHVNVAHDAIKARIASKYHEEYDAAVGRFMQRMLVGAGAANQAWATKRQHHAAPNPERFKNSSRPGYSDGAARLADMDLDGVQTEVIYSELSFFRYWGYLDEANTTPWLPSTTCFTSSRRPTRHASWSRTRSRSRTSKRRWRRSNGWRTSARSRCSCPCSRRSSGLPDYYHERYDPLLALIQETGLPICCHIGLNTSLDGLVRRDPTPGSAS